jgi:hypothetical protein
MYPYWRVRLMSSAFTFAEAQRSRLVRYHVKDSVLDLENTRSIVEFIICRGWFNVRPV